MILLVVLNAVLVVVTAIGLGLCRRELRALRRDIVALDEGEGRRAAAIVGELQASREPLAAIRASVEELSPNLRATVEQPVTTADAPRPASRPTAVESTGLRLPRPSGEDRESDGETRIMRQPTAAELARAGAGGDAPAVVPARTRSSEPLVSPRPPAVKIGYASPRAPRPGSGATRPIPAQELTATTVCRMCEGGGALRARSGAVEACGGCNGSGFIDATEGGRSAELGDARAAQLPR